jgi:type 1 glutamine amidotransferase
MFYDKCFITCVVTFMHRTNRRIEAFIFSLAAILLMQLASFAANNDSRRGDAANIRVLIVDGYSNHDWQLTTRLLRGILEPSGICKCSVSTAPPTADSTSWNSWHPKFSNYDVVIQTCNDIQGGPSWPVDIQQTFEEFVRNGGGVLIFHSGNNAFPNWPAYNEMIGLGWRKKEQGVALAIGKNEKIERIPAGEGENTTHGARSDVLVHLLGKHPIHSGIPRAWKTPELEVYTYARGPAHNLEVLSYGYDPKTNMNWPLEWTTQYGLGRVYSSTFGHVWRGDKQPKSMRCAGEQTLVLRAVQWLAKRSVTIPVPADFPSEDAISVRAEIELPK